MWEGEKQEEEEEKLRNLRKLLEMPLSLSEDT